MKRLIAVLLIMLMIFSLASCSRKGGPLASFDIPNKEEVAPYKLSEKERDLLKLFRLDLNENAQVFSFKTPKGTKSVEVNVYALSDDLSWESIGGTGLFADDHFPVEQQGGLLTMTIKDNYIIDFYLKFKGGTGIYSESETIDDYGGHKISYAAFLSASQKIELNKEIPVAILVYDNGTSMRSYTPGQYFNPEDFVGMDLVQAVTLKFTDEAPPAQ